MALRHNAVLAGKLARALGDDEVDLVSGANPPLNSRCVFPYMETPVDDGGPHILCDPCDDVGFP